MFLVIIPFLGIVETKTAQAQVGVSTSIRMQAQGSFYYGSGNIMSLPCAQLTNDGNRLVMRNRFSTNANPGGGSTTLQIYNASNGQLLNTINGSISGTSYDSGAVAINLPSQVSTIYMYLSVSSVRNNVTGHNISFSRDSRSGNGTVSMGGGSGGDSVTYVVQAPSSDSGCNDPAPAPNFSISCTPASTTITAGSSTSFNLSTTAQNGFNSNVNFTHSISPNAGNVPGISYSNNNRVPPATTTATISTSASTTPATYNIIFTATSGSITKQCSVQLIVNAQPAQPAFTLSVTPANRDALRTAGSQAYNVTANCSNMNGPITGLQASSPFSGLSYSFSSTTVACGGTVTLTVGNLGSVPNGQLSDPQQRLPQNISVTGTAAN